jgi:hypothetical protein
MDTTKKSVLAGIVGFSCLRTSKTEGIIPVGYRLRPAGFAIPQLRGLRICNPLIVSLFALQMLIFHTAGLQIRQDGRRTDCKSARVPDLARNPTWRETRPGAEPNLARNPTWRGFVIRANPCHHVGKFN